MRSAACICLCCPQLAISNCNCCKWPRQDRGKCGDGHCGRRSLELELCLCFLLSVEYGTNFTGAVQEDSNPKQCLIIREYRHSLVSQYLISQWSPQAWVTINYGNLFVSGAPNPGKRVLSHLLREIMAHHPWTHPRRHWTQPGRDVRALGLVVTDAAAW